MAIDGNEISSLHSIDANAALQRLQDNHELYLKLLLGFRHYYADAITVMSEHVKQHEWQQAGHFAHKVKGVGASVGAESLHGKLGEFECACYEQNETEILTLLAELDPLMSAVLKDMEVLERRLA